MYVWIKRSALQLSTRIPRGSLYTLGGKRNCEDIRGFTAGESWNLVVLTTLDVRNAFNSTRWADMLRTLQNSVSVLPYLLRMLQSYLQDWELVFNTLDGPRRRITTACTAQGSILGPDVWNIAYDGVLWLEMLQETFLVGVWRPRWNPPVIRVSIPWGRNLCWAYTSRTLLLRTASGRISSRSWGKIIERKTGC